MSQALDQLIQAAPPTLDVDDLWRDAINQASRYGPQRSSAGEPLDERLREMRDLIGKELVAFHEALIVTPHAGDAAPTMPQSQLWDVAIPLTLFPKRDHGFSRLECIIKFAVEDSNPGTMRVLRLKPSDRTEVLARVDLGARLQVSTNAELNVPIPELEGTTVANVAGEIYGGVEVGRLTYEATRSCVESEIVGGTGGRWRLDDLRDSRQVAIEGHQLSVVLEVADAAASVSGAGYLQAYSDTNWLTHALDGSLWEDFSGALRTFFRRGLPTESYAEWNNIVPGGAA